jgi:hypothetical protein
LERKRSQKHLNNESNIQKGGDLMIDKGITPAHLRLSTILLGLMVGLGLVLASDGSQVKATSLSSTDSMPRPFKHPLEQYTSYSSHITIDPSAPTPDDVIRITVGGEWFNVCVPRYQSHQVNDNTIRIEAVASFICMAIEGSTSWSFAVEVGPLPIGLYTVELYLYLLGLPGPLIRPILYNSTSFMVATERLYLPVILRNH